jgi:hypothetical protein
MTSDHLATLSRPRELDQAPEKSDSLLLNSKYNNYKCRIEIAGQIFNLDIFFGGQALNQSCLI